MTQKLSLSILLLLLLACLFISSCVGTNDGNIPVTQNQRATVNVVNLVPGAGDATVAIDNQSIGTAAYGADVPSGSYLTLRAGGKSIRVAYSGGTADTTVVTLQTDQKARLLLSVDTSGTKHVFALLHERFTYEPAVTSGRILLRFYHGSYNTGAVEIIAKGFAAAGGDSVLASGIGFGNASSYLTLPAQAGNDTLKVVSGPDTLLTLTPALSAGKRYTQFLYNTRLDLRQVLLTDD